MLQDLGWLKQVKLEDSTGVVINPATVEKLDELKVALTAIYNAVDDLELTTESIKIESEHINLNTDDLEAEIQSVRDQLDVVLSTRASELTLSNVKTVLDNIKTVLDTLGGAIDVNLSTLATESTLTAVKDAVDTLETKLQTIIDSLDVELSTRASEATVTEIKETIGQESGVTVLSRLQELRTQLDVNLSTRASESTVSSVNTKFGEVSATPTANTLLGRLKDLYDKLVELFNNGVAKIKLWDGTNQANITSDNKLQTITSGRGKCSSINSTNSILGAGGVFNGTWEEVLDYSQIVILIKSDQDSATDGLVLEWSCDGININAEDKFSIFANIGKIFTFGAVGIYYRIRYTNGSNPQGYFRLQTLLKHFHQKGSSHRINDAIVGEDDAELVKAVLSGKNGGNFVNVKVDEAGRLETISPTAAALANTPIQICFERLSTAVNNYEWQEILEYTVPIGYDFNAISFCAISTVAHEAATAVFKLNLGSFIGATDTFTDGEAWSLPRFAAKIFVYVTTAIGSGSNDVITITYTNQIGITGRTGTVTIPKNSNIGTRLEVSLQAGDYGVTDVTNVTHSATGQVGNFNIEGNLALFTLILTSSNVQYIAPTPPLNSTVVPAGGKIYLQYKANSAVPNTRGINLTGSLAPR